MNINDKVTVILTEYGKEILDNHRTNLQKEVNLKFEYTLMYDENGKYTTQLWHLMNIFGQYMTLHSNQVFLHDKIYIE